MQLLRWLSSKLRQGVLAIEASARAGEWQVLAAEKFEALWMKIERGDCAVIIVGELHPGPAWQLGTLAAQGT
ncbi:MAG: hypothetical protein ABWY06_19140 [Pseudomonas sp.]|uniref:hypothetical protein n=1 Tax=Pseudomonas sp. TaxID=306 RepID=UPI0033952B11